MGRNSMLSMADTVNDSDTESEFDAGIVGTPKLKPSAPESPKPEAGGRPGSGGKRLVAAGEKAKPLKTEREKKSKEKGLPVLEKRASFKQGDKEGGLGSHRSPSEAKKEDKKDKKKKKKKKNKELEP